MSHLPEDPNRVLLFDTTLRDGEQSPGISLNAAEKLEIAQQLARLGVDIIEAGFPIASPGDFEAVQTIAREVQGPVICGLARANSADIDRAWEAIRDSERPRIHTFLSTSDIHIEHQLQSTREDVKGLARASVAQAKALCEDVEFSPMDATRSEAAFTAEVVQIALDEGATTINIPDTVGYAMPDEYAAVPDRVVRDGSGPARCRALGALPRRPGPRRRQLAGGRPGWRAPDRVRGQRHRRARGQRVDRGADHAPAHAPRSPGLHHRRGDDRDRQDQPPDLAADRLPGPAQQGDRRPQRLRPRVRHPPGRRPEGARDLRDHGRDAPSGWTPTRSCWASTPAAPRCARRWRTSASTVDGAALNAGVQALQGDRGPEEAGHARWTSRRWSPTSCAPRSRATRWSGSTSRPPTAARRTRRSRSARPTATVVEGSFTGDGPVDAIFRAINSATKIDARLREFRVDAVTGGQDALGEVSVVVELGAPDEAVKSDTPGVLTGQRVTGAGQAVTTDIIEAAAIAYVRALGNAVTKAHAAASDAELAQTP